MQMLRRDHWLAGLVVFAVSGCATVSQTADVSADLPAFQRVDEHLYRGGQPSLEGLRQLKQMGVKTVVSLRHRTRVTEEEERAVKSLGMRWVNLPMLYWWRPTPQQIRQFITLVDQPDNQPVFVHCRKGQNRAGIMTAIYRIVRQHWTPEQAYEEGRQLGLVSWNVMTRNLLYHEIPRTFKVTAAGSPGDFPRAPELARTLSH